MIKFNNLSDIQKRKYITQGNATAGITVPSNILKDVFPEKDPIPYVMCANYKVRNCKSRLEYKIGASTKTVYISDQATCIDKKYLANIECRDSTSSMSSLFKDKQICTQCVDIYYNKESYFNISRQAEVCVICKVVRGSNSINTKSNGLKLCSTCNTSVFTPCSNGSCLAAAITPLKHVFTDEVIAMDQNIRIHDSENNVRFLDMLLKAEINGTMVYVMIEKDENQHSGYDKEDEYNKIIDQVNHSF